MSETKIQTYLNHDKDYIEVNDLEPNIYDMIKSYCDSEESTSEEENITEDKKLQYLDISKDSSTTNESFACSDQFKFKLSNVLKVNVMLGARELKLKMISSFCERGNKNNLFREYLNHCYFGVANKNVNLLHEKKCKDFKK